MRRAVPAALGAALLALGSCGHDVTPAGIYGDPASLPVPRELRIEQQLDGSLFLEWEEDDAVFAVIDGWHVYRGVVTGLIDETPLDRVTARPHVFRNFIDRDVEAGRTYAYQVRAVSPAGIIGGPGSTVALTVDLDPPGPPPGLAVEVRVLGPDDGCPAGTFCAVAALAWLPPPDPDVAAYRLYRRPPFPGADFIETPFRTFEDIALSPSAVYAYRVTALDFTGNESVPSAEVEVTLPAAAPSRGSPAP